MHEENTLDMFEEKDFEELSEIAAHGNSDQFNSAFGELLRKYSKKKNYQYEH